MGGRSRGRGAAGARRHRARARVPAPPHGPPARRGVRPLPRRFRSTRRGAVAVDHDGDGPATVFFCGAYGFEGDLCARRSTRCRRPSACARAPAARCARRWTCSAARCCRTRRASRRCWTGCSTSRWCRSCASTSPRTTRAPPGLVPRVGDPHVGAALRAMHAEPARQWTVAELAAEATLSRSAFARRFTDQLGVGPLAYLTEWRMALARERLRDSDDRPRRGRPVARLRLGVRLRRGLQAPPRRRPGPLAHGEARRGLTSRGGPPPQHSLHADAVVEDVDDRLPLLDDDRDGQPEPGDPVDEVAPAPPASAAREAAR